MVRVSGLLAVAAISTIGMGFAVAADLPVKAPYRSAVVPAASSWSGCYVGGHVGYGWSDARDRSIPGAVASPANPLAGTGDPIVFGYDGRSSADGIAGGVQAGCDHQYGTWVIGAVIDYSWTDQKDTSAPFQITPTLPTTTGPESASINLQSYGTARGRVGFIINPTTMVYGTGGLAWARAKMTVAGEIFNPGTVSFSVTDTANFVGWAAGLGAEWKFAQNWTFGVEYLHMDFGDANFRFGSSFLNQTTTDALQPGANVKLTTDVVRVTANYHF
jgi:outer membrane immunogenic protein